VDVDDSQRKIIGAYARGIGETKDGAVRITIELRGSSVTPPGLEVFMHRYLLDLGASNSPSARDVSRALRNVGFEPDTVKVSSLQDESRPGRLRIKDLEAVQIFAEQAVVEKSQDLHIFYDTPVASVKKGFGNDLASQLRNHAATKGSGAIFTSVTDTLIEGHPEYDLTLCGRGPTHRTATLYGSMP